MRSHLTNDNQKKKIIALFHISTKINLKNSRSLLGENLPKTLSPLEEFLFNLYLNLTVPLGSTLSHLKLTGIEEQISTE
ncbi:hypothetical protein BpHYR1_015252 [Brachionus plicatilis]|uniref:Uncharacterized protein n=1 Tax=Brachionus plicatilis TaxID=10195 RepID=A0A3M7Q5Q3_BRAPC|nr:hypothetical protein BpHYR1_015252 [Brachionus plicatilis]